MYLNCALMSSSGWLSSFLIWKIDTVRDAMQSANLKTLQGPVSFDENGDIVNKVISVFQITHDAKSADDDVQHQYKYIGVAPESPTS